MGGSVEEVSDAEMCLQVLPACLIIGPIWPRPACRFVELDCKVHPLSDRGGRTFLARKSFGRPQSRAA